jgi:hypothetical protein
MGSDKEDLARWADLVLDGKPINIDQTLRQQAETIADLREAVRVLAARATLGIMCAEPNLCDVCRKIRDEVKNNPIAAEAVRKAGG